MKGVIPMTVCTSQLDAPRESIRNKETLTFSFLISLTVCQENMFMFGDSVNVFDELVVSLSLVDIRKWV